MLMMPVNNARHNDAEILPFAQTSENLAWNGNAECRIRGLQLC